MANEKSRRVKKPDRFEKARLACQRGSLVYEVLTRDNREKVHRCDRLAMITKKSQPAPGGIGKSWGSPNPSRNRWFR